MKLAKVSVTPKNLYQLDPGINDKIKIPAAELDKLVASIKDKIKIPATDLEKLVVSIKDKLQAQPDKLKNLVAGINDKSKKYVLVGYHDMQLVAEDDAMAKECFEIFNTQAELENKMKKRQNIWCYYDFGKQINDETKLRYESFFSGFLHYYDTELRNGMIDHTIWCHWDKKNKKDRVTVYLYPAPLRHPMKSSDLGPATKTPQEYVDLMKKNNKKMLETVYNKSWIPPQIQGLQSDPPAPTGPPPPSA